MRPRSDKLANLRNLLICRFFRAFSSVPARELRVFSCSSDFHEIFTEVATSPEPACPNRFLNGGWYGPRMLLQRPVALSYACGLPSFLPLPTLAPWPLRELRTSPLPRHVACPPRKTQIAYAFGSPPCPSFALISSAVWPTPPVKDCPAIQDADTR